MPKKFIIEDETGKEFEITEEELQDEETEEVVEKTEEVHDEETLSPEDIIALKSLAAKASDILKLLEVEEAEHEAVEETEDEEPEDVSDEEVIETTAGDSKKSVGAIEKAKTNDSISYEDREIEIANAWTDRFKKSYKGE